MTPDEQANAALLASLNDAQKAAMVSIWQGQGRAAARLYAREVLSRGRLPRAPGHRLNGVPRSARKMYEGMTKRGHEVLRVLSGAGVVSTHKASEIAQCTRAAVTHHITDIAELGYLAPLNQRHGGHNFATTWITQEGEAALQRISARLDRETAP